MGKVSAIAGRRKSRTPLKRLSRKDVAENKFENIEGPIETQHLLISSLLPENVKAFLKQCEEEVVRLCGGRHQHSSERRHYRWGSAEGSIVLANQRVALEVPRVRKKGGEEVRLETYEEFQNAELFDKAVFTEGIKRVSQRDYEKGASKLASSFGFKKSSVSKRWIKATAKKLAELQTRSLKELDIRAVFIDGKRFRTHGVIVALGVASDGRKYVLGIYQASSENHESCLELFSDLERRGLPPSGLLFIVDGGSGLNKAFNIKYACDDKRNRRAIRIRCYVHKWRNIEAASPHRPRRIGLRMGLADGVTSLAASGGCSPGNSRLMIAGADSALRPSSLRHRCIPKRLLAEKDAEMSVLKV